MMRTCWPAMMPRWARTGFHARTASADELSFAFRFVFLACAMVLSFGMSFLISMEERPLRGPATKAPPISPEAPPAPAE